MGIQNTAVDSAGSIAERDTKINEASPSPDNKPRYSLFCSGITIASLCYFLTEKATLEMLKFAGEIVDLALQ